MRKWGPTKGRPACWIVVFDGRLFKIGTWGIFFAYDAHGLELLLTQNETSHPVSARECPEEPAVWMSVARSSLCFASEDWPLALADFTRCMNLCLHF